MQALDVISGAWGDRAIAMAVSGIAVRLAGRLLPSCCTGIMHGPSASRREAAFQNPTTI